MTATASFRSITCRVLLLAALVAVDARAADGEFEQQLAVAGPIALDVDTGSGSIEVRSGPEGQVTVRGEIRVGRRFFGWKPKNADEIVEQVKAEPPVELEGNRLRVGYIRDRSIRKQVSISFEIIVPVGTEVRAESGSGSVSVTDIAARVSAETGSGSVRLDNIGGPVDAETGSGSIRADGVAGAFNGSTGSGSIYLLQTAPGDVVTSTGSGSSELKGVAGSLQASAGSGRITVDGRIEGDWRIMTGSGSVRVTLPPDAAFELEAESSSGSIDLGHPVTVGGKLSKNRISGLVRGGGPLLYIDTSSGSITVR